MSEYHCLIVSPEGNSDWRLVEALDERQAVARLMADGLTPIDIRRGALTLADRLNQPIHFGRRIGIAEQALILTQLAVLTRAGLPIDRSIDLLRDQSPKAAQKDMLAQILAHVRSGGSLARAIETQKVFPGYAVGVIRAAEQSGRLGEALDVLAKRMTLASATRQQLVTALTYPAAILAATIAALVIVLIVVVPQFDPVFAGNENKLPALTRGVIALSATAREGWFTALAVLGAFIILAMLIARSRFGQTLLVRYRDQVPGMGLRDQYLSSQFMGIFGTLLANGVTAIRALPLAREGVSSRRWKAHISQVEREVREGRPLSVALGEGALLPSTAIRLIEVGERSGHLAQTCEHASQIMGEAARSRIERIVSLVNPIAIITLGGLVAMLVAGVMLGIFAMGDFA